MPIALNVLRSILDVFKSYQVAEEEVQIIAKGSELWFRIPSTINISQKDAFSLVYYYGVTWDEKDGVYKRYIGESCIGIGLKGIARLKKVLEDIKDMNPSDYLKLLDKAKKRKRFSTEGV